MAPREARPGSLRVRAAAVADARALGARASGDGYLYEPKKWDGFRCLVFRDRGEIDMRSRNDRPLARYCPELVTALARVSTESFVLDGETSLRPDPASISRLVALASPRALARRAAAIRDACFADAFDLLAHGTTDVRSLPFPQRRKLRAQLLESAGAPLFLTPATAEVEEARRWLSGLQGGIDGVVARTCARNRRLTVAAAVAEVRRRAGSVWLELTGARGVTRREGGLIRDRPLAPSRRRLKMGRSAHCSPAARTGQCFSEALLTKRATRDAAQSSGLV